MKNKSSRIAAFTSIWTIACASQAADLAVQRLVTFGDSDDGTQPTSLIQGADGFLYGTTRGSFATGGSPNGSVFKLMPGGELNTLASFDPNGTNGCCPGALVQAQDGSFYGATAWPDGSRGTGAPGGIFHLTTKGELRTIFSFSVADGRSARVLLYGTDGNLYGTTTSGGASGYGTVFKLTPTGEHTILVSFSRTNGINPTVLVRNGDGTLFGTTSDWISINAPDTVFKLNPAGEFATLSSSDEGGPRRPWSLIIGADGNLYGVDRVGGSNGFGSIFRMTPAGAITTLAEFNGTNGWDPDRLIQGADGNFYGATAAGGADFTGWIPDDDGGFVGSGSGVIFQITPVSEITALASLTEMPGDDVTGFVLSTDGVFYGARTSGGPPEPAGIFRAVQQPIIIGLKQLEGQDVLIWRSVPGGVYQVEHRATCATSWTPLSPTIIAASKEAALTNVVSPTAQHYYRVRLLP